MQPLWWVTKDGDLECLDLYERHYSAYQYADGRKRKLFVGPGEKLVLRTERADAMFVWRRFIDDSGQAGINCAVFRNEGPHRSSDLIRQADSIADCIWPGSRHYTYVNPQKIASTNPGFCFLAAGWQRCGWTKGGLLIMERISQEQGAVMTTETDIQATYEKWLGSRADDPTLPHDLIRDAFLAGVEAERQTRGQPAVGEEIHVHIEGLDVLTLPLASSGIGAPRFVVHVPAQPDVSLTPDVQTDRQDRMPSDAEILACLRPLYSNDVAAAMGAEDDLRTARLLLSRYAAPVAAQAQRHEFDDCAASPTGKHSESWFANGDCEYCKAGAQPDAPLFYARAQPVVNQQMTTDTALADTQRAIIEAAERRGYERAIAECAQDREDAGDPLQGAANWLVGAIVNCSLGDLQRRLLIGHNRAGRLLDAARAAKVE